MPLNLSPLAKTLKTLFGRDDTVLREALKVIAPEELAVILNGLSEREQVMVLTLLEDAKLAAVLWHVSPHTRNRMVGRLGVDRVVALMPHMESDEIVDLIQLLDRRKKDRVIEALKKSDPKKVLPLLGFEEETAGGLMKSEFLKADKNAPVEEVRRTLAVGTQKTATVYVTEADGTLIGVVALVKLAAAPAGTPVSALMHGRFETIPVQMPQEQVVHRFAELEAVELPVVDARRRLLGVISADDLLGVIQEELAEDLSRFSGVSEDEHISDPAWLSIRRRLPWLVVNLATAVLAAWVVSRFQDTISKVVILAAYMPVVAGMGGNAVTQTLGVSIRALALNQLHAWDIWKISIRQTLTGAVNGFATGTIAAAVAWWWTGDVRLAAVLIVAMTVNLLIAGAGGVLIPVTMKRLRIDPALASAVFATTLTDVVGFFAFLGLASIFLA